MLTLRCFSNFFKGASGGHVAFKRRADIMQRARNYLTHADKNTRQAAITLYLNYSIYLLTKEDLAGRADGIAALAACVQQETDL